MSGRRGAPRLVRRPWPEQRRPLLPIPGWKACAGVPLSVWVELANDVFQCFRSCQHVLGQRCVERPVHPCQQLDTLQAPQAQVAVQVCRCSDGRDGVAAAQFFQELARDLEDARFDGKAADFSGRGSHLCDLPCEQRGAACLIQAITPSACPSINAGGSGRSKSREYESTGAVGLDAYICPPAQTAQSMVFERDLRRLGNSRPLPSLETLPGIRHAGRVRTRSTSVTLTQERPSPQRPLPLFSAMTLSGSDAPWRAKEG